MLHNSKNVLNVSRAPSRTLQDFVGIKTPHMNEKLDKKSEYMVIYKLYTILLGNE